MTDGHTIIQMVYHAPGVGGAPFHGTAGRRIMGGPQPDLELRETSHISHIIITKMLGVHREREIRVRLNQWMEPLDWGIHEGLRWGTEAEG